MGRKKKRITKAQMRIKCFETRKRLDAVHHPYFVPKTNNGDNKGTSAHPEALPHNSIAPPPPPYDAGTQYCDANANNFLPPPPPEAGGFPPHPSFYFYGCYFPEQYAPSYYYYGNNYHHPEYYNSTNNNNTSNNHSIDADDIPATVTKEEEDSSMAMTTSLDNRRIIANSVPSTTLEVALAAELDRQTKQNKEMSEELDKLRRIMYSRLKETQDYEPAILKKDSSESETNGTLHKTPTKNSPRNGYKVFYAKVAPDLKGADESDEDLSAIIKQKWDALSKEEKENYELDAEIFNVMDEPPSSGYLTSPQLHKSTTPPSTSGCPLPPPPPPPPPPCMFYPYGYGPAYFPPPPTDYNFPPNNNNRMTAPLTTSRASISISEESSSQDQNQAPTPTQNVCSLFDGPPSPISTTKSNTITRRQSC